MRECRGKGDRWKENGKGLVIEEGEKDRNNKGYKG